MAKTPAPVTGIEWLDDVEDHDYDAAHAYLSLLLDPHRANLAIDNLRDVEAVTWHRANDVLRAADRPALGLDDPGVRRDLGKVLARKKLSPVLIVSFEHGGDIADGYHRVSLSATLDPFSDVPARLANIPGLKELNF